MATTRKVGLKIEVDGEKEYKSAIADLNRGNQVLASELRKVQEQFKGNENSIEALNAKGDVLQRQLLQQQDKVQTLRAALQNAATQYGEADRRTQEWQIKLNNAETAQAKLERSIEENNKAINDSNAAMRKQVHSVEDLDRANEVLAAELRKVQEQYRGSEKSVEALTEKGNLLQKQLENQQKKVDRLRTALKEASDQYGENDERTREWVIKLANAETEQLKLEHAIQENNDALHEQEGAMENAGDAVGGLGDQLDGLAGKLGVSIPDAAKGALNEIDGFSASAVASFGLLAGGAAAVINVTQELFDLTKQAAAEADALLTRSAQTGLSTDLLQQLDYAQKFLDFDGIDKSLQRLTQSMGNATVESSKQAAAFQELGVSIYDGNGKLRNNYEVFLDVIDALGAVGNETKRDIIANQLFGKSYAEMLPLIKSGSAELKKYTDQAKEMGYIVDEYGVKVLGRLDDAVQENQTAVTALKNQVAVDLAPLATDTVDLWTMVINGFRNTWEKADLGGAALNMARAYGTVYDAGNLIIGQVGELTAAQSENADSAEATAQRMADATGTMQESVQALAEKYREAQEKYKDMLDGQFGLFEDASERLVSDSDAAAAKLAEFWQSAYDSAEKSISGQFGLFDEASTSVEKYAEDFQKAWDANFKSAQTAVHGVYKLYDEATGFSMKTASELTTASHSQADYWTWYSATLEKVLASGISGVEEWAKAVANGSNESAAALGGFLNGTQAEREEIVASWQRMKDNQDAVAESLSNLNTSGSADVGALAERLREKADEMAEALQSQTSYWEQYEQNLAAVFASGVDGIQEFASQYLDGSAKSVEAIEVLAAATDEQKAQILASWQALQEKQSEVAAGYADMAAKGEESSDELAESTESYAQRQISALDSQLQYWETYRADFDALKSRNIDGIAELASKFEDGSEESKRALAELRSASDDEIAAIIQKMREVDNERGGLSGTFAMLDEELAAEFAKIKGDWAAVVQEIAGTAGSVDFGPFNQAVEESFSFLAETSKNGNVNMAAAFKSGSEKSRESLEMLKTATGEEIETIIGSLGRTEKAKDDLSTRFSDLAVDVPKELQKIATEFDNTVQSINTEAKQVDFAPFETSVDEAFSFLEDRAGNSVSTVRGWLGELSREIAAVEARAANVNVGHNAGGTDYWQGGLSWVAENGPELVELPRGSQVHTAQETRQILGQSTDTREMEAKLGQTVSLLGQIAAELAGLKVRGRMA